MHQLFSLLDSKCQEIIPVFDPDLSFKLFSLLCESVASNSSDVLPIQRLNWKMYFEDVQYNDSMYVFKLKNITYEAVYLIFTISRKTRKIARNSDP